MMNIRQWALIGGSVMVLASCGANGQLDLANLDPDLRVFGRGGFDTAEAAATAAPRPQADQRGVISYPGYQVAIARQGDTVSTIAARLGLNAGELARHNALGAGDPLNPGAVIALPTRVAAGAPAAAGSTAAAGAAPIVASTGQVSDPFAGQGVRQRQIDPPANASVTSKALPAVGATQPASSQPRQHVVASGETAWSVARKYNVSVNDLAQWNGLPSNMNLRVGQRLLIPVAGAKAPAATTAAVTAPGSGSPTPQPPSAAQPLPAERTTPTNTPVATPAAPNLGQTRTAASGNGRFRMPVNGAIIRPYQKGKNDGIDISAAAGSQVSAAGAGTVAAITRDVDGVPIIVVRHDNNLMTVYAGLDDVSVSKGQQVSSGTALGKARGQGVVHFEVRNGFESTDPEKYLN